MITQLSMPSKITSAMMRRSQHRAPEALNADLLELLDEADVLKQDIEQAKAYVDRHKEALAHAEKQQVEKESKLEQNLSQQLEIRRQLATQFRMESSQQQMSRPPSKKRTKLSSSNTIEPATPDAVPNPSCHRPGLVPNPDWSQATWKDHVILANDQFELNRHIYINQLFTNVELIDNSWYEMFCPFCGANTPRRGEEQDFFKEGALKAHMRVSHRDDLYKRYPGGIDDSELVSLSHMLSRDEIKALRSGKMIVKTVRGNPRPRARSEQTPVAQNDIIDEEILRGAESAEQYADQESIEPSGASQSAINDVSDEDIMAVMKAERIIGSSDYIPRATSRTSQNEPGATGEDQDMLTLLDP
ncbi:hypothetical protein AC579_4621 [Pseudocercospora musae]|uniref:Uncharacterized protein n=1 Tax=Pseudocercospora musae TaxID=113226 RepID=A0A139HJU4_9PEZI|nr:hypothetical protein AC579_4621 [Pseudocercospora musae]